jgi:hypothetical protein
MKWKMTLKIDSLLGEMTMQELRLAAVTEGMHHD